MSPLEVPRAFTLQAPERHHWLRFEASPEGVSKFLVSAFIENNDEAQKLAQSQLIPRVVRKEPIVLDFINVRVCTQSFAHALLYEVLRFAWASCSAIARFWPFDTSTLSCACSTSK